MFSNSREPGTINDLAKLLGRHAWAAPEAETTAARDVVAQRSRSTPTGRFKPSLWGRWDGG